MFAPNRYNALVTDTRKTSKMDPEYVKRVHAQMAYLERTGRPCEWNDAATQVAILDSNAEAAAKAKADADAKMAKAKADADAKMAKAKEDDNAKAAWSASRYVPTGANNPWAGNTPRDIVSTQSREEVWVTVKRK